MAKYNVDIEFVPTWENASELLMDIAALYTSRPTEPAQAEADHSNCISLADHQATVQSLEAKLSLEVTEHEEIRARLHAEVERLTSENARLREAHNTLKASTTNTKPPADSTQIGKGNMPHVGEIVTILPGNDGKHQQYYGGIVKAIHGSGGSKGIEVLPRGHGHTIIIERKYIKRKAVNERQDNAQN